MARFPPKEKVPTSADLPLSHEAKRVLAYASEEAERLRHFHIGAEHIALGLLREPGAAAAEILTRLGITVEGMRAALARARPGELDATMALSLLPPTAKTQPARG